MRRARHIVVGLGYGDEGKGTVVDALTRRLANPAAALVVRFNGGAQAGHNVVTPDGRHHTFSQWGSGTFAGAGTFLSEYTIVDPLAMAPEAEHLQQLGIDDPWSKLYVDERALIVTPYQRAAGRLRELLRNLQSRGHGSCGMGIGEAVGDSLSATDALLFGDLHDHDVVMSKLRSQRARKLELAADVRTRILELTGAAADAVKVIERDDGLDSLIARRMENVAGRVCVIPRDWALDLICARAAIFEGAQGVLLDEWSGFHPYTTWSTTTSKNAITLLTRAGLAHEATVIGAVRAFSTRHGNGPLVSEAAAKVVVGAKESGEHNQLHPWQGSFRYGWFDFVATRYAIEVDGAVSGLAVTCLDKLPGPITQTCVAYNAEHGRMVSLKVPKRQDLEQQERLTRVLMSARPHLRASLSAHMSEDISSECGIPLVIESRGPTALDKHFLGDAIEDLAPNLH